MYDPLYGFEEKLETIVLVLDKERVIQDQADVLIRDPRSHTDEIRDLVCGVPKGFENDPDRYRIFHVW